MRARTAIEVLALLLCSSCARARVTSEGVFRNGERLGPVPPR